MTRSYKPGPRLEASAQELLESLNGLILREARQVAVRRRVDGESDGEKVSFWDILDSLEKSRKRGQRRERGAFAAQVTFTAIAISSAATSLAISFLAVGTGGTRSGSATSSSSLLVTVILAMLLIVSSATLIAFFREPRESREPQGEGSPIGKARKPRHSRREDELALLKEWLDFEDFMKRELCGASSEAPVYDLSSSIVDFSRIYDLDPEEIRSILRVRNMIVHDPRLTSSVEIHKNLLKLRLLLEKLSPVRESD